ARRISVKKFCVFVCEVLTPKSQMCVLQKERALKCGVTVFDLYSLDSFLEEKSFDLRVTVDCIFGSGFHGELPSEVSAALESILRDDSFKIACDIPTGLDSLGNASPLVFNADVTVTMGALKTALFSDEAKDCTGIIKTASLGITESNFTPSECSTYLLEKEDLVLPLRKKQNVNKGSFGHAAVVLGEKTGAAVFAGQAAFAFGAGLVTLVKEDGNFAQNIPFELMTSSSFPENTSAAVIGPGLGRENQDAENALAYVLEKNIPCVLDADIFYHDDIKAFLEKRSSLKAETLLTPHPKEFCILLEKCGFGQFTVQDAVKNRIQLAKEFCKKFPGVVLLLKGAVTLICVCNQEANPVVYFNRLGTAALSKGGSGDVLCGMTAALLAQKKTALQSAVYASLAHALSGAAFGESFSLTPQRLIEKVSELV
ncbi:MAG: NAD(P)H-hydrate dehydratase, partial [Treponema sp.]|nr:NAD(P)H-hydrate dehydratase [Treponema sp.]